MSKIKLTLSKSWQNRTFRKSVCSDSIEGGERKIKHTLVFNRGEVVELDEQKDTEKLIAIADCIGASIDVVNDKNRADKEMTLNLAREIAEAKIDKAEDDGVKPSLTPLQMKLIDGAVKVKTIEDQNQKLALEAKEDNKKSIRLASELTTMSQDFLAAKEDCGVLEVKIVDLTNQVGDLKSNLKESADRIAELEDQEQVFKSKIAELQNQIKDQHSNLETDKTDSFTEGSDPPKIESKAEKPSRNSTKKAAPKKKA